MKKSKGNNSKIRKWRVMVLVQYTYQKVTMKPGNDFNEAKFNSLLRKKQSALR